VSNGNGDGGHGAGGDVALFVDWENLKYSLAQRERRPNVAALRGAAERFGRIVYARAYADWQEPQHAGEAPDLYLAGLEPVYVPTRRYSDGQGMTRVKDSVDVKLTADCIEASHQFPNISTFIIASGDHGFLHVVNTLRPRGKRVVVVGVSWSTAKQLTEPADVVLYYDLDVDRTLSDHAEAPPTEPSKVDPAIADAANTAARLIGPGEGTGQELDRRALANALQLVITVVHEFREAGRELSVSFLGQELSKRMPPAEFARVAKGRATNLAQALQAHALLKLVNRNLQDLIYLPDEQIPADDGDRDDEHSFDFGRFVYQDLKGEQRDSVIAAIESLHRDSRLDYLTFKRVVQAVAAIAGRDEFSTYNLVNSMIAFGVLRREGRRSGRAQTGAVYEFETFDLDRAHPDVREALHLP